jgi:hypothetical protein
MRHFLSFMILLQLQVLEAQFSIAEPIIHQGAYAITDTIYMDPNGSDAAPGTFAEPVRSFDVAVQRLPYGTSGINGGNAYGLIMLKEGDYITTGGFHQFVNTWQNGDVFKNVSIEGLGEVTIGGTVDEFATGHLLQLSGDHIFIRNIRLQYATGIGILVGRNSVNGRQQHVLIEDVVVDSVGSFSMLLRNVDTILVRNCSSLYSSRPGADDLTSPGQWPSGINFYNSTERTIHDSEIAYTRGEGLNFQNCVKGQAYRNKLHDNGLNFYNENSARITFHHNLIYNTPGIGPSFWRNCPADTNLIWASGGILIANEGSCDEGNFPQFQDCATRCSFPDETFLNVDSLFIFNNIIQNTGNAIGFWQGATTIAGVNCIRNVFVFNNTIIGTLGMPGVGPTGFVSLFFPEYNFLFNSNYSYLQNVRVNNNIFTYDTEEYAQLRPVTMVFHALHPGPKDITFDGNLWVKDHDYTGPNDLIRPELAGSTWLLTDSLGSITPCFENMDWIYARPSMFPFLTTDYVYSPRPSTTTNVGAIEFDLDCMPVSSETIQSSTANVDIYPNPCFSCNTLYLRNLPEDSGYTFDIFSSMSSHVTSGIIEGNQIELETTLPAGMYFVVIHGDGFRGIERIVVL